MSARSEFIEQGKQEFREEIKTKSYILDLSTFSNRTGLWEIRPFKGSDLDTTLALLYTHAHVKMTITAVVARAHDPDTGKRMFYPRDIPELQDEHPIKFWTDCAEAMSLQNELLNEQKEIDELAGNLNGTTGQEPS